MTPEKTKVVEEIYNFLLTSETNAPWDDLDDQMMHLEYLEDSQILRETEVQFMYHSRGKIRCYSEFCNQGCYADKIVMAVTYILDLHKGDGAISKENRYVLESYLALSHIHMIVSV